MVQGNEKRVETHYTQASPADLGEAIFQAVAAVKQPGPNGQALTVEDFAPVDEFHLAGLAATEALAQRLHLTPAVRVLDVGSGLGGPSRFLAARYGCQVTGLDLTEPFVRAAGDLAARLGLSERVTYRHGSALDMPFADESFDVVWTQHAAMNIADKARLYAEIRRVLKPGGRLALQDIMQGPGGPVLFPVPWARVPEISFLITPERLRNLLEDGFHIVHWNDWTQSGLAALLQMMARQPAPGVKAPPPLNFGLFMGADTSEMMLNVKRGLEEGRLAVIEAVASKP